MKTNNEKGRSLVVVIGIYLVIKFLLNTFLGGGINFSDLIFAAVACVGMYSGLQYVNFGVAVILGLTVLSHLKGNITGLPSTTVYLIEAVADVMAVILLVGNSAVKEHFTNRWSEIQKLFGK